MRRLRALMLIGVMWALVWLPIGIGLSIYGASQPKTDVVGFSAVWIVAAWTVWGAISGILFALTLTFAERRRTLQELAMPRMAIWGAIGAMTLPFAIVVLERIAPFSTSDDDRLLALLILGFSAALGAVCGAMTLAIARRAPVT